MTVSPATQGASGQSSGREGMAEDQLSLRELRTTTQSLGSQCPSSRIFSSLEKDSHHSEHIIINTLTQEEGKKVILVPKPLLLQPH